MLGKHLKEERSKILWNRITFFWNLQEAVNFEYRRRMLTVSPMCHESGLIKGCDSSHSYDTLLTHYIPLYTTITTILYMILYTIMYILVLDSIIYQLIYHWYILYTVYQSLIYAFWERLTWRCWTALSGSCGWTCATWPGSHPRDEGRSPLGKPHGIHGGLYIPCDIPQWSWW